ncbi:MAG: type III PLP-dependent enzyme [Chloroflexi bacterium]|nr:type III PLP-dependent enzyme [Chloroflexota bacterium]
MVSAELIARCARYETPFLLVDRALLAAKYRRMRQCFPYAELLYAVKANPDPEIIRTLAELGCGFEISSAPELNLVSPHLTPRQRVFCSNPIKSPSFVRRAFASGQVVAFAVDSLDEIEKLATLAPGSQVYARIVVDNSGSDWPLTRKYGIEPEAATDLLARAADLGLAPIGTTFHVGSQNRDPESWLRALAETSGIWNASERRGLPLTVLSLGGGMPIQHHKPVPPLEMIGERIAWTIAELFPREVEVTIEPGRALVGDAAVLVATIIGRARRGERTWIYLDVGVFNGLMETIDGFRYEVRAEKPGPEQVVTLAGPSCDSVDVLFDEIPLPDPRIGDRLYFINAGAYTTCYASSFNGWPPPSIHVE